MPQVNVTLTKADAGGSTSTVTGVSYQYGGGGGGAGILNGSGAPGVGGSAPAGAAVGVFYIDTTASLLYGPYDGSSSWTRSVSLVGPTGSGSAHNMYIYNVKTDYSAAGDGVTDDKAAIQAALDAAYAAGGGIVYLPRGVYMVSAPASASLGCLQIKDNVTLMGDGMDVTIIRCKDFVDLSVSGIVRTPSGVQNNNVTIQDLTLDGNLANQTGVGNITVFFCGVTPGDRVNRDKNIRLYRVRATGGKNGTGGATVLNAGYGFDPHELTENILFDGCIADGNQKDGFVLDGQFGFRVVNCTSFNNGRHGFNFVTESYQGTVSNCRSYSNGTLTSGNNYIVAEDSHDIVIDGCMSDLSNVEGIKIRRGPNIDDTRVIVKNNRISKSNRAGLVINGAKNNVVVGNTFFDNGQSANNTYNDINLVSDNGGGVTTTNAQYNLIADNRGDCTLSNKTKYGIAETAAQANNNVYYANYFTNNVTSDYSSVDATSSIRTGAAGANGSNGSNGTNGNTILNGSGAPSGGTGVDGDFYINTAAKSLYGPKTAGSWGSGTSLINSVGAAGSGSNVQYNNGSNVLAGSAGFQIDTVNDRGRAINGMWVGNLSTNPVAPSSGFILSSRATDHATSAPTSTSPNGYRSDLDIAQKNFGRFIPCGGSTSNITQEGFGSTTTGTATSASAASTNILTRARRIQYVTSTSASQVAGIRGSSNLMWRGNAAGLGGFKMTAVFGVTSPVSAGNLFVGLVSGGAFIPGANGPNSAASVSMIGIGFDNADSNAISVYSSNGSTVTKGSFSPSNPTLSGSELYELVIECNPNASTIYASLRTLGAGATYTAAVTATLPSTGTFMAPQIAVGNAASGAAATIDISSLVVEWPNA